MRAAADAKLIPTCLKQSTWTKAKPPLGTLPGVPFAAPILLIHSASQRVVNCQAFRGSEQCRTPTLSGLLALKWTNLVPESSNSC